eukprot:CAMPEP_0113494896 /NCGR_PEP_ID=MMETSP0014_2-20120614/29337_1 /TAXON_ID=2857 /ORGANISM="Nitzschia sp." /LENGTH=580 /DNA_ID=CAMNT_0000388791 /DNA_START=335 /DNA_END=2077 /DNA_ORIENTATION=- /assembly_acc=CAM_ASM_000159
MHVGNPAFLHGSAARMSLPLSLPGAHNQMFGWNVGTAATSSSPSPSNFSNNNNTPPELMALMATTTTANNSSVAANERLQSGAGKANKSTIPTGAVRRPLSKDVLLGRGKPFQLWKGNQQMLNLIDKLRPKYDAVPRNKKGKYIEEVLRRVKSDGGKFMERHVMSDDTPYWIEVTRSKAYYKVGHAFRSTSNRNRDARTIKTVHGGQYDGTESSKILKSEEIVDLGDDTKRTIGKKKTVKNAKPSKKVSKKKKKSCNSKTSLKSEDGAYKKSSSAKKSPTKMAFATAQSTSPKPAAGSMQGAATLSAHDEYRQRLLAQEELLHKNRINAILAAGGTPLPSHSSGAFPGTSSIPVNQNALLEELRQREAMMMMQSQASNEALFFQRQLRSTPMLTNDGLDIGIRQRQQQQQQQQQQQLQLQALNNRFPPSFMAAGMSQSQSQASLPFSGMSSNQIPGQNFGMNPNVYETLMARQSSFLDSGMPPQGRAGFNGSGGLPSNFGMVSTNVGLPSMNQMGGQQQFRDQLVVPNLGRSNAGVSAMFLPNQQLKVSGKSSPSTTKRTKKNTPKDLPKLAGGVAPKKR